MIFKLFFFFTLSKPIWSASVNLNSLVLNSPAMTESNISHSWVSSAFTSLVSQVVKKIEGVLNTQAAAIEKNNIHATVSMVLAATALTLIFIGFIYNLIQNTRNKFFWSQHLATPANQIQNREA